MMMHARKQELPKVHVADITGRSNVLLSSLKLQGAQTRHTVKLLLRL
jgi:hypothetical protein